jgi:hypothetical protein
VHQGARHPSAIQSIENLIKDPEEVLWLLKGHCIIVNIYGAQSKPSKRIPQQFATRPQLTLDPTFPPLTFCRTNLSKQGRFISMITTDGITLLVNDEMRH